MGNVLEKYNNGVHDTTKMTLFELSTYQNRIPTMKPSNNNNNKQPKIQVWDFVKEADKRTLYSKGYTTIWSTELFKIHTINKTSLVTYTLDDGNGEIVQGKCYEQELSRSVINFESNSKTKESLNIFHKLEYFFYLKWIICFL